MAKKYKIERNLVLNQLKEGGAEDSVLVIDGSNEVGAVPRSEFGGGGGSQDLQSVLDNGSSVVFDGGNSTVDILAGSENDRYTSFTTTSITSDFNVYASIAESQDGINITSSYEDFNTGNNNTGVIKIGSVDYAGLSNRGNLSFEQELNSGGVLNRTVVYFDPPIANVSTLKFPAKPSGNYTIATLDDIPTGLTTTITIVGFGTFTFTNGVLTDFLYFPIVEP